MKNVKKVKITVSDVHIVSKINSTPVLRDSIRGGVRMGENVYNVNHYQMSRVQRLFGILPNVEVEEVI